MIYGIVSNFAKKVTLFYEIDYAWEYLVTHPSYLRIDECSDVSCVVKILSQKIINIMAFDTLCYSLYLENIWSYL